MADERPGAEPAGGVHGTRKRTVPPAGRASLPVPFPPVPHMDLCPSAGNTCSVYYICWAVSVVYFTPHDRVIDY